MKEVFKCAHTEVVPLSKLVSNPKNPNNHPKKQIELLAKIIDYQGQRSPIVVSKRSGFVTKGHGRLAAITSLSWKNAAVDYQDYDSEAQEYADMIADNKIAELAEHDDAKMILDIPSIPDLNLEMLGMIDFKMPEVFEPQADEDAVPEFVEPKSKLGDIYQLGRHRLMCGDSTSIDAVEKLMNGEKADMVFTDPPYGYNYESNYQTKHSALINDDKILDFLPCAFEFMAEDSSIYVCGSHQTICRWRPLIDQNFTYKNLIVWKKNNWSMGDLKGAFAGQHELIFYAVKGKVELRGERSRDVWEFDRDPPKDHPTQKPIALVEFAISKVSDLGQSVLDLFGGSGSTLIACEKTNRKCFMMELDPHYVDVIVARWEKYTGKTATLLGENE